MTADGGTPVTSSELQQGVRVSTGRSKILRLSKCPGSSFNGVFSCPCWKARINDPKIASVLKRVFRIIGADERSGYDDDGAARALRHYLNGSGEFVEIPSGKVESLRRTWESRHTKNAYGAVVVQMGSKARLALKALTRNGLAMSLDQWPLSTEIDMNYSDGPPEGGALSGVKIFVSSEYRDDLTEYFGARIRSDIKILCTRSPNSRRFTMRVNRWRSYIVDNYDWEGDKQFLNFPTQQEMRGLADVGCAKPYQRSSASWEVPPSQFEPWEASFEPPSHLSAEEYVRRIAAIRQKRESDERRSDHEDAKSGALPPPSPAEEMAGRKGYWWFEPDERRHTCM